MYVADPYEEGILGWCGKLLTLPLKIKDWAKSTLIWDEIEADPRRIFS